MGRSSGRGLAQRGRTNGIGRSDINIFNFCCVKICKEIEIWPRGRHLFACGLLPFQNRRHVFLRELLPFFATCTCRLSHNRFIFMKKGGLKPPLLYPVPQRYNIFRRKANCVKMTGREKCRLVGCRNRPPCCAASDRGLQRHIP